MSDYIPGPDSEFNTWSKTFMTALTARANALGVTPAEMEEITSASEDFDISFTNHTNQQAAAAAGSQDKQQKREKFMRLIRAIVRRIQTHPAIDDGARAALGITIPTGARTTPPAPTTRPVFEIDTSQRLRHTIPFADELTPDSRAKPAGVLGAEIRYKVSDTPITDPEQMVFLAIDTASPYVVEFSAADAGKVASYMLRWVSKRDEKGPWSRVISATIIG